MVSKAIKKKIKRIAERFDISLEQAKRFYFDRKEANLKGMDLPFHKWKKRNLNFDDTMEGNDVETGDFDNFFNRKRQKQVSRVIRRTGKKANPINLGKGTPTAVVKGIGKINELRKRRARKIRLNKKLLAKLSNPRFLANPKNARKVRVRLKKMAQQIANIDKALIRRSKNKAMRKMDLGFDGGEFMNTTGTGNKKQNFFQKNKFLLIGAGVVFLFFTPMGKKLISK
tara:strand:+ start:7795 stop:8475 length:681 start_codon:yes stop_codon:yes gene_type:complete